MSSKGITSSYEVARDGDGNSTSITWTFKKYSNCTYETQNRQIDAEGTMEYIININTATHITAHTILVFLSPIVC